MKRALVPCQPQIPSSACPAFCQKPQLGPPWNHDSAALTSQQQIASPPPTFLALWQITNCNTFFTSFILRGMMGHDSWWQVAVAHKFQPRMLWHWHVTWAWAAWAKKKWRLEKKYSLASQSTWTLPYQALPSSKNQSCREQGKFLKKER